MILGDLLLAVSVPNPRNGHRSPPVRRHPARARSSVSTSMGTPSGRHGRRRNGRRRRDLHHHVTRFGRRRRRGPFRGRSRGRECQRRSRGRRDESRSGRGGRRTRRRLDGGGGGGSSRRSSPAARWRLRCNRERFTHLGVQPAKVSARRSMARRHRASRTRRRCR